MSKAKSKHFFIIMVLIIFCLTGCNEEDCLSNTTSFLVINFENAETNLPFPERFVEINIQGINGRLYPPDTLLAIYALPINPHANRITYIFRKTTSVEQITFSYTKMSGLLSSECPPDLSFQNLEIVEEETTFTSFELKKNELNNVEIPNVTIYR